MQGLNGHRIKRILIIGGSGFLGNTLYKELLSYFDVYGTYAYQEGNFGENQVFFKYIAETDDISTLLFHIQPDVLVTAFKSDKVATEKTIQILSDYALAMEAKLIYLSSVDVFDAHTKLPSYELDKPLAESDSGKHHLKMERIVRQLPSKQWIIARLPLILGVHSPELLHLKQAIKHNADFEIYPNLVISTTTNNKIAQQIHYLINQDKHGVYHLSSEDMTHHDDLFVELAQKISDEAPIFKKVYSSNEDRYLAILPKENKLPKNYRISVADVIADSTLKDEIATLKQNS